MTCHLALLLVSGNQQRRREAVLRPWSCHAGLRVGIRLAPAASLRTIGPSAADWLTGGNQCGHQHVLEPELRTKKGAHDFAQHLLTKAAERLRRGGYYCRRLGVHLSWGAGLA